MAAMDEDVQMEIDEPAGEDGISSESKVVESGAEREESENVPALSASAHLLLGSAFGMKVPPPEYSGIPQEPVVKEPDQVEVVREEGQGDIAPKGFFEKETEQLEPVVERRAGKSKSKKKKNREAREDSMIMPLISAPPSIVSNPPSRITGPIELDEDDLKSDKDKDTEIDRGSRGKGQTEERVPMEDRERRGDSWRDDDTGPGRGRGWQRPRHGKYKYPDDFDEEDFEDEFDDYGRNRDYGRDFDDYGPPHERGRPGPPGRDFGPGPRPMFGQRPNYPGPPHPHGPPPPGYGPRNFGPDGPYGPDGPGNFGPPGYGPGPMMGPRGPPMGPGGPPMGPGGPPMGPGGPQMGPGGPMGPGNFPPHGFGPGPMMGPGPPQGPGFHDGYGGPPGQGFPGPQGHGPWQGDGFQPPPPQPNFNMPQPPQTFSGEVFHPEGLNRAFPAVPSTETTQPKPPVTQESAEKLIAMGMNPDLAKILEADKSKFRSETGSGGGTPKKKSKKKKKKGDSEKAGETEQSFEVDEVPLPMSIPLPDDVPLPPEPKKKKKKKRDKDLENVMFPPLPDVEPIVGPAPKPATPPIPVLQPEETVLTGAEGSADTLPQLPQEESAVSSQYPQQSVQAPQLQSQTGYEIQTSVATQQQGAPLVKQTQFHATISESAQPSDLEQVHKGKIDEIAASTVANTIQNQIGQSSDSQTVSQMPQTLKIQQQTGRRSRFDPNWTPERVPAAPVVQTLQTSQLPVSQQAADGSTEVPQLQQQQQQKRSGQSPLLVSSETIEQEIEPVVKPQISHFQALELDDSDIKSEIQNQPPVSMSVGSISEENINMMPGYMENDEELNMETEVKESKENDDNQSQLSEGYGDIENRNSGKEENTGESQIPKEPVTASQLLEKFKQKQQLKKSDSKSDLTKFPVVLPTPLTQKMGVKDDTKMQDKNQGKFTFAIRKLKQLEAEKEEEEKQVLTALSTEEEQKDASGKTLIEKQTVLEKVIEESSSKEREIEGKPKSLFKDRKKKSRTKSPERKSRSRSDSRERKKNRKHVSVSRDRSKSRERRKSRDRSRSLGRRSKSRDRSRSRERQRRSRSKKRERSLSPWRKDREFFKRYGRFPRPGEADSITYESSSSRDRGRFSERNVERNRSSRSTASRQGRDRSRERSRDRRSRDRESKERRSKDRESRERRSRDRESRERRSRGRGSRERRSRDRESIEKMSRDRERRESRDRKSSDRSKERVSRERDSRERSEDRKDRKKKVKERKTSRESEAREMQRSRERKNKDKDKKKKTRKEMKVESSSRSESSSETDSETDRRKKKKKTKERRARSSSAESSRKVGSEKRTVSVDRKKHQGKDRTLSTEKDVTDVIVKKEPIEPMEVENENDKNKILNTLDKRDVYSESEDIKKRDKTRIITAEEADNVTRAAEETQVGSSDRKDDKKNEKDSDSLEYEKENRKNRQERSYTPELRGKGKSKHFDYADDDEGETSKQTKEKTRAMDKDKRNEKYRDVEKEYYETTRETRKTREDKSSDYYRTDRDRDEENEERYRKNRDRTYKEDRQERYKEKKEDKYRESESSKERKERTKYDNRESDSDSDRNRSRKHKDYDSDSDDNYRHRRKDDGHHRRLEDRQGRPEHVDHTVTKSRWDSGSESEDDYERSHNEEIPRSGSSARSRKEEIQAPKSMSGTVKLEIDISKINQLKLLNKMMKAKQQRESGSEQSSDSSDEYDSKSKKKQKKEKQSKKKNKKDRKRHEDSDSENEDSPVKHKKKKKNKKKKRTPDEESDDEVGAQRKEKRKNKEKHVVSDSDISSDDERKSKKRYKESKKVKKYDSESDDSTVRLKKSKDKRSKERESKRYDSPGEDLDRKKRNTDKKKKTSKYETESEEERSVRNKKDKQRSSRDSYDDSGKKSKSKSSQQEFRENSDEETRYIKEREKQKRTKARESESIDRERDYTQRHRSKETKKEIREKKAVRKGKDTRQSGESDLSDEDTSKRTKKGRGLTRGESDSDQDYKRRKREVRSETDEEHDRKKMRSKERKRSDSENSDSKYAYLKGNKQYPERYSDDKENEGRRGKRSRSSSRNRGKAERYRDDRKRQMSGSESESDHGSKQVIRLSKERKGLQKDKLIAEEKRSTSKEKRQTEEYFSEKTRKRSRSPGSRSKSRSRSQSKIFKSEKQRKRYPSESGSESDGVGSHVQRRRKDSSSDEEKTRKQTDERRKSVDREQRKRHDRECFSPERDKYEKDKKSLRKEAIDVKDKYRKDRDEDYDEDYKSRRKREVDKRKERKRYSSSYSGNSSSTSSDSGSDSDVEKRSSKKTGQKNVEAGTGSEMGPVPGTPQTAESNNIEIKNTSMDTDSQDIDTSMLGQENIKDTKCNQSAVVMVSTTMQDLEVKEAKEIDSKVKTKDNDNVGATGDVPDKTSRKQSKKKEKKDKKHKKKKKKKKKKHSEPHAEGKTGLNSSTDSFTSVDKDGKQSEEPSLEEAEIKMYNTASGFHSEESKSREKPKEKRKTGLLVDYDSDGGSPLTGDDRKDSGTTIRAKSMEQKLEPQSIKGTQDQKSKARISFRLSVDSETGSSNVSNTDSESKIADRSEKEERNIDNNGNKKDNEIEKDKETVAKDELYDPFEMLDESSGSDTETVSIQKPVSAEQSEKKTEVSFTEGPPVTGTVLQTTRTQSIFPVLGLNTSVPNVKIQPVMYPYQAVHSGVGAVPILAPVPAPVGVPAPASLQPSVEAPILPSAPLSKVAQKVLPSSLTQTLPPPAVTIPSLVADVKDLTVTCSTSTAKVKHATAFGDVLISETKSMETSAQKTKQIQIKTFIPNESQEKDSRSKVKSRWDTDKMPEKGKHPKTDSDDMYDPFALDSETSSSQSPKIDSYEKKSGSKTTKDLENVRIIQTSGGKEKTEGGKLTVQGNSKAVGSNLDLGKIPMPEGSTSLLETSIVSKTDITTTDTKQSGKSEAQKVTMKFTTGRKVIGKSAIMTEDVEDDELSLMPKLKLSTPDVLEEPAKKTVLDTKMALKKSLKAAESIERALEKSEEKAGSQTDRYEESDRRKMRSESREMKAVSKSTERTRKRSQSQDSVSKDGAVRSRERSGSKSRKRKSSLSLDTKHTSPERTRTHLLSKERRSGSRDRREGYSRERKQRISKERSRSKSPDRRPRRRSSRDRQKDKRDSRERSVSREQRHRGKSKEKTRRSPSQEKQRRRRSHSKEWRKGKSKTPDNQHRSYRDDSPDHTKERHGSPRNDRRSRRRKRSTTRSRSPSEVRERTVPRKRTKHKRQSSSSDESEDTSDSESSASSSDDDSSPTRKEKNNQAGKSKLTKKSYKEEREVCEDPTLERARKEKHYHSDSVDGSSQDSSVETSGRDGSSKSVLQSTVSTELESNEMGRDRDNLKPSAFKTLEKEEIKSSDKTLSSATDDVEHVSLFEKFSPEKREIQLHVSNVDPAECERNEDIGNLKGSWEKTPTGLFRYSPKRMSLKESGEGPAMKLFDRSTEKSQSESESIESIKKSETDFSALLDEQQDDEISEDVISEAEKPKNITEKSQRLTRRQAAEQNLLLPSVMSKDMPTRGKKGRRSSAYEKTVKETDSNSDNCEETSNDSTAMDHSEMSSEKLLNVETAEKSVKERQKETVEDVPSGLLTKLKTQSKIQDTTVGGVDKGIRADEINLKIEDIPMPPSSTDENKNTLRSKAEDKTMPKDSDKHSDEVIDMELDETDQEHHGIEIIHQSLEDHTKKAEEKDFKVQLPRIQVNKEPPEQSGKEEAKKLLEEAFHRDAAGKGFSIKLNPNTLKKTKQTLTHKMLEDVFDTEPAKQEKHKPSFPVSNESIKSIHFTAGEFISPKPAVVTAAVASFKPLPEERPESSNSQAESKTEEIGLSEQEEAASNIKGPEDTEESKAVGENLIERTDISTLPRSSVQNTPVSDLANQEQSHNEEELKKAENILKKTQISPEQIGKAIQVIGQENLRRLEVLTRESVKVLQGKKIEVVGQRADTIKSTASSRFPRSSTSSHPDELCSQSLHQKYDDADLSQLEREKQELLMKLHTPDISPAFVVGGSISEDHIFQGDSQRTSQRNISGDREMEENIQNRGDREMEENILKKDRDRDRYNNPRDRRDDDYDDRRSGRTKRDRRRSRDSRSRERSRERDRYRGKDRGRSRDRSWERNRSRDRSRERKRKRRNRDEDRHRSRRKSRSRSWSRERRSRSRERRNSRERKSRSRGRDRRSRSRGRRSRSHERRSRSRDRRKSKRSRSRSRDRRSRSLSRDKKYDRNKDEKPKRESALEKFEKELAEKKKILLQPVGSSPITSTPSMPLVTQAGQQMILHQDPNAQFVDAQGQFIHMDPTTAPHFLPQPFPVHQQHIPGYPMGQPQTMPDPSFQRFPNDPNMFPPQGPMGPQSMPPMGQQFGPEGIPPHIMPAPMHPGPQPFPGPQLGPGFGPGMFPAGPLPHLMDPNAVQPGYQPVHMEHPPAHIGPDTTSQVDRRAGFQSGPIPGQHRRDTINVQGPQSQQETGYGPVHHDDSQRDTRHRSLSDNQRSSDSKGNVPEEDLDRTPIPDFDEEEEETLEFKHGFGGPGIPGHPPLKSAYKKDDDLKPTKERKRKGKRVSRFEPRQEDLEIKEEGRGVDEVNDKTSVEEKPELEKLVENTDQTDATKLSEEFTGFGKWQPVSLPKEPGASYEQEPGLPSGQFLEAELSTPQSQSEEMSDSDAGAGKPMKVKSRWRRASEAEVPPPPPPPTRKEETDTKDENNKETDRKDDDEDIPINFDLIDENVYLTERKRSKQMREVRRMVCDCTTSREDREMGYEACGEDCLNRMLFIECGSKCPCGDYCMNKRFQKKQNAKVAPFKTDWKGHGLKALEDLEPGQFVMEYVGEVLDYPLFKKRSKQYSKAGQQHFYFMAINPEEIVDATTKGNISRFINHSCDPNCETQKWTVNGSLRVGFFVRKPIKKDEEITFDYKYEVYGKEAQKCYCGTAICRGWLGGDKRMELRSTRRSASVDESEKKKKEQFDDSDKLEEEIERMSELHQGLRNKNDVLNMCRLMVRAEDPEHRLQILRVLDNTEESACLRLFLDYHGLPLLWCWMADVKLQVSDLKHMMLKVLKKLPITNKTILQDSKILDIVTKWSDTADGFDPTESSDALETTQEITDTDNTENDDESMSTPPVTSNKNPVSILASIRDKKSVKKSVKFAEVESSSDSESRASASETDFPGESVEGDVSSSSQTGSRVKTRRQLRELRRKVLEKDSVEAQSELAAEGTQSADADSSSENQSESSQIDQKEENVQESEEKTEKLSESVEISEDKTMELSEETDPESKTSVGISEKDTEELEMIVRAAEIKNLASDLLEHWSTLKEVYKIPKKQVLEERKRTERELDSNYEKIAKIEERKKKVSGWDTVKARKRKREPSFKDDTDDSDSNTTSRKHFLVTPPRMSKSERRQLFEAQVKAQDELQRAQEQMQQEQYEQEQLIQQQHQRQLMQDPAFWYYATQDPNFLPSIGIDPHQFLHQLAMDPALLQQLMATIPNFQQQLEHLTYMYQQAVLQASQFEMTAMPEQPAAAEDEPMTEQHIAFLQQVEAFKQQHLEPKNPLSTVEEEDIPPPPSPPKGKAIVLPPNWKTAKDSEGKLYYYHTVTRQTQWDPPTIDTGEHADDMDLGTPTQDDTVSKYFVPSKFGYVEPERVESNTVLGEQKEEKEKTTTAAADTSSEMSRKLKEQFKAKMSSWIVVCLNPFRKQDCKMGRVSSTEDFKHLARKLTHHVMAKELKHCRHVEDLEVNENVKSKAKDFVKKYMAKFGATYKRSGNSPTYD